MFRNISFCVTSPALLSYKVGSPILGGTNSRQIVDILAQEYRGKMKNDIQTVLDIRKNPTEYLPKVSKNG